jgi:predicted permease
MRLIRIAARLALLAPEPLRSELRGPGAETLAELCADARRRHGVAGLARTGIAELCSLIVAALRYRTGGVCVSGGRPPRSPDSTRRGPMDHLRQDIRTAWRSLTAARGTAVLAIATLALGIGINTAVFSVLDAILIRPVPYAEADRLATVWRYNARGGFSYRGGFAPAHIAEWRRQTDLFDRLEGAESRSYIYTSDRGAQMLTGSVVTPGLMSMLGAAPLSGRLFVEGDGRTGTDRRAIVSERFWRSRLGGTPDVLGRDLVLDGERHEIVGVMPDSFRYPNESQDLWVPFDVGQPPAGAGGARVALTPIVRSAPGLTFEAVQERTRARGGAVAGAAGDNPDDSATLMPLGRIWDERAERSLLVLGGAVFFLLLIVCANVANLTLSKAISRARDRAVRSALGASRARLVREAFVEHGLVGLAGAALGVWIAALAIDATVAILPEAMTISSLNAIDLDLRALAFLAGTAALTVLLFGLPPALVSSRAVVGDALRRESRGATGSAASRRLRSGLVVAEVGLSIVLLVGAALMTRTVLELQAIDIGMDTERLLSMELALPAPQYAGESGPVMRDAFIAGLLARLRQDPDVVQASAGALPPNETMVTIGEIEFGHRPGERTDETLLEVFDVWPGFFSTTGIRVIDGRDFREDDVEGAAVVSEGFARQHWPDGSAVGARFRVGDAPWRTVVGVVSRVRGRSDDAGPERHQLYYPRDQVEGVARAVALSSEIAEYRTVVVRAAALDAVAARLPELVHAVDPTVVVADARPVEQSFADAIARPRVVFFMMTVFAGFGLLLAAAGLYGVLSHLVAQRMREAGIRLALGATPRDIGRAVFGSGLLLAGIGVALGVGVSLALARQMQALLYETEPFDPLALIAVCVLLMASATVAAWRPARRAMRADPVTLLREE